MKGKALPFLKHEQFSVSYSCVAYIEQSDSLKLKVFRIAEELELKCYWKVMAILRWTTLHFFFFTAQPSIFFLTPKGMHMGTHIQTQD